MAGFRRQTLGFVNYRIKAYALLGETVNRSIGLAGPVGIIENHPRRGDGRLELNFSRAVFSKELQSWQPPEREAFVRPGRFGRHDHLDAAMDGMLREFRSVVSVREGKTRARCADFLANLSNTLFNIFQRREFCFSSQNGVGKTVSSNAEPTLMKGAHLLPSHKSNILVLQVCVDAVAGARALHSVN